MRIACCLLLLLAHSVPSAAGWSSGIIGSQTAIRRRSTSGREVTIQVRQSGFVRKKGRTQQATAILRISVCRTRTASGRQRWNDEICDCWLCTWCKENRRQFTDTYVQNKASRIETREIVLSTPAGIKPLGARHALQSPRIAPRPRPMCPAGLHMSE